MTLNGSFEGHELVKLERGYLVTIAPIDETMLSIGHL